MRIKLFPLGWFGILIAMLGILWDLVLLGEALTFHDQIARDIAWVGIVLVSALSFIFSVYRPSPD